MKAEKIAPRLLGAAFLFVVVTSLSSGLLLASAVGSGSISDMLVNVSHQLTLMRLSSLGELVTSSGIVALAGLLYIVLHKQHKIIALVALGCWLAEAISLALSQIGTLALLPFSPLAIQQARQKAWGIPGASFVEGDVSQLSHLGIGGPFDFVLDIGCFHGLSAPSRQAYAQEVARVTRSGALFMIWAIESARRPSLPGVPAIQDKEIARYFGRDFILEHVQSSI